MAGKLNDFWYSLTPEQQASEIPYFMHSGHFRPSVEALNQNLEIGIDTLIVYEGPFVGEQVIRNEGVSKIINVYGTKSAFDITDFMQVVEMGPIGAILSLMNMNDAPVPFLGPVNFTGINDKGENFNIDNFNFEIVGARHNDFSYNSSNSLTPEQERVNIATNLFMRKLAEASTNDILWSEFFIRPGIELDNDRGVYVVDPLKFQEEYNI